MKKYLSLIILLLVSLFMVGCEKVEEATGDYKEGVYFDSVVDDYGGSSNTAIAVVTVDDSGKIISVFLDTTYTKNNIVTTKKSLGDDYGMKKASEAGKEWFEQVNLIEARVIQNQGLNGIVLKDDGKIDSISGVTMRIDALYKALNNALDKAKK